MNAERRPVRGGVLEAGEASVSSIPPNRARSAVLPFALATVFRVVGTRGRRRLVLLVCCAYCDQWHCHSAHENFVSGKRTAACHQGCYVVHVGAFEAGAA